MLSSTIPFDYMLFLARTLTDTVALLDAVLFTARKKEFTEYSKSKAMIFYSRFYPTFTDIDKDPIE